MKEEIKADAARAVNTASSGLGCFAWLILLLVVFQPGFGPAVTALVWHWAGK